MTRNLRLSRLTCLALWVLIAVTAGRGWHL